MNGKLVAAAIVIPALVAGAAIYALQVYAFYSPVPAQPMTVVTAQGQPFALPVEDWQGIDGRASPQKFRACFRTHLPQDLALTPYPAADPLIAPGWFGCFDARGIGEALASGEARAYLSQRDIHPQVDRVIALFPDGRAYAWQQLNPSAKD